MGQGEKERDSKGGTLRDAPLNPQPVNPKTTKAAKTPNLLNPTVEPRLQVQAGPTGSEDHSDVVMSGALVGFSEYGVWSLESRV